MFGRNHLNGGSVNPVRRKINERSIPQVRAEIAFPEIVENRHDGSLPDPLGDLVSALQISSRRLPNEPAALCEPAAHFIRLINCHRYPAIDNVFIKNLWYNVPRLSQRF